ncbi:hypothetical protein BV22DRAFT_1065630 [Leucogyrophana mollusca]|uniref:Uncharacterized protein n=1 Tax=Leucogyrophana mollusca TaxID=85980 RepID=A0ACB8BHH7_9AGAM|nr:hypothetical protein BV22DRAFT_1065630 [Leucogyrophana mollusca]
MSSGWKTMTAGPLNALPSGFIAGIVLVTVFHCLAFISTTFRLWFRCHIRRVWWEDVWAASALCFDIICLIAMWAWTVALPPDRSHKMGASGVVSYWLLIISYTCVIWSARLSIVFSIIRIVPPTRTVRSVSFGVALLFVSMWVLVLTAKAYSCARDTSWHSKMIIQCPFPTEVAIIEMCTDVVADAILVGLPLRLLWRVKLPKHQRVMILVIFSSSFLTSVASVVHTAYLIPTSSFIGGLTAEIEGALSLVVCNLLVIVTFVYRVVQGDITADLSTSFITTATTRASRNDYRLTTVDLEFLGDASGYSSGQKDESSGSSLGFTTPTALPAPVTTQGESDSSRFTSTSADRRSTFPPADSIRHPAK